MSHPGPPDITARVPGHPIETPRLTLRPFTAGDFDDLYAYQSRPDVARYLHWVARDRAQARQALDRQCREITLDAEGDWLSLAVVLREAGTVIGETGLKWLSREHKTGRGPDLSSTLATTGKNSATEAAGSMLTLGFDNLGWHRIIGSCDARNQQSARLMERLGMRQEAHFIQSEFVKGRWTDELVYAILDHEWEARRAKPS